jgi:phage terminase small subunit
MRLNISDSMLLGIAMSAIALGTKWVWNIDDAVKLNEANQIKHESEYENHNKFVEDRMSRLERKTSDNSKKLDRKEVFCQVLAETNDQSAAYRAMLPDTKATQESIWARASMIAKSGKVKLRVAELRIEVKEKLEKKFGITAERVSLEIARLAFNDPRKAFVGNELKDVQDWPDEVAACISSIKINTTKIKEDSISTVSEIKFWDKGKQLDLAARHMGMLNDRLIVKQEDSRTDADIDRQIKELEEIIK